jgi:hypothetical protein
MIKKWLYVALILLFILHNDLWFWSNTRLVRGVPVGLLYHIVFCIVATLVMTALTRYAWPEGLEVSSKEDPAA